MRDELVVTRLRFDALVELGEIAHAKGQSLAAAVYCQIAANYAWNNHCGMFASGRLERLLRQVGLGLSGEVWSQRAQSRDGRDIRFTKRRVLHVMSEAYATGGHTRMVARWLNSETAATHAVVLTRQSVCAANSILVRLGVADPHVLTVVGHNSLLERANSLRRCASSYDVVILHVHPDDVVPVLAFADPRAHPPVLLVNHADHVFWVGVSIATMILSLRESGQELAISRRGAHRDRCSVITRPLDPSSRKCSRREAKVRLGLDPDRVVLTSIAAGSKYAPIEGIGLVDLVEPILDAHPEATLVVAGLAPDVLWLTSRATRNRNLLALGEVADPSTAHLAADIYLDSYPFSSLTSLLESGSLGNPIVTYRGRPSTTAVLGADSPGLDGIMLTPTTPDEFATSVGALISDARRRSDLGEDTRVAIETTHDRHKWNEDLRQIYRDALELSDAPVLPGDSAADEDLDQLVLSIQRQTGYSDGLDASFEQYLGLFPWPLRLRIALARVRSGAPPAVRSIVSPETLQLLRDLRSKVRDLVESDRRWQRDMS